MLQSSSNSTYRRSLILVNLLWKTTIENVFCLSLVSACGVWTFIVVSYLFQNLLSAINSWICASVWGFYFGLVARKRIPKKRAQIFFLEHFHYSIVNCAKKHSMASAETNPLQTIDISSMVRVRKQSPVGDKLKNTWWKRGPLKAHSK